ncbi:hypothetical protein [Nostoc parmelioides]|uniref:DUF4365 domain-containing protein n=1 Tax=Nostoc parmelioides FACHB-3921 TaxID=2692909 RepID=A0ABR8BMQ9_9NOSO|nr:hypothetical protein [Nostoc parmelioides]MBD2254964.1 hypothetical protein [Nostoc parmelioides FACHB-3921]
MLLKSVIDDSFPYEWNEDYITLNLIKGLRKSFNQVTLSGYRYELNINWEVYKYTGKPETLYGDIAVLVQIKFRNGELTEGVGFLEAKIRSRDSVNFESLKPKQLSDITSNAPHALLLLYDYESITTFINSVSDFYRVRHYFDDEGITEYLRWYNKYGYFPSFGSETHSVVVPANLISINSPKNTTLYNHSLPLSNQLCYRYLLGFDLEYNSEAINIAKGYSALRRYPKYVMVIHVGQNNDPPELETQLNLELLQPLQE